MQLDVPSPVASATPDGAVVVEGSYLKGAPLEGQEEHGAYYATPHGCCDDPMCGIDRIEDRWRERVTALASARYMKAQSRRVNHDDRHPLEIDVVAAGLRRGALLGERFYRRDARSEGYRQRSSRGRR